MDPFTLTLFLLIGLLLIYHFIWEPMTYFEKLKIQHQTPVPIFGNLAPALFRRISMSEHLEKLYKRFSNVKYFGMYNFMSPVIVIRDPDLITSIAVKNFDQFCDHRVIVEGDIDPLMGKNLFSLKGDRWREMRRLLSPAFTSMKMKIMYDLISECANSFSEFIAAQSKQGKDFDIKDIFGRYTTDVIATCSFGISIDSMRNPKNEFYLLARKTMNFMSALSFKFMFSMNFPRLSKWIGLRMFSKEVYEYFYNVVHDNVNMRRTTGFSRPDMIQLMMESEEKGDRALTIEEMTCQAFVFFFAGYETTTRFLCFALHEIGTHPDIQAKLRAEIEEVVRKTNGNPTYDSMKNMPYMDAVLNETLRLHALAFSLDRVCIKEFELPPATPNAEPITVKPGDLLWFPVFGIQRDSKYYDNPLKFDPDRFINSDVPQSAYLPFGVGPRVCIGNRFALLESKILFFYLLWRCNVEPCAKTQMPIKYSKKSFALIPETESWMNLRAR